MFKVKNWDEFQHYKDRRPPWIKLHRTLMENRNWFNLSYASRSLALCIWLLASEHEDPNAGLIDSDIEEIAFRARMDSKEVYACTKELINQGFIEFIDNDASDLLAPCYQLATPETESETETESEYIYNKAKKNSGKNKVTLKELSLDHIKNWLTEKRHKGLYLDIDEERQLEIFKNYCESKGKRYKNYIAAFKNSFNWNNVAKKRVNNERLTKQQRIEKAGLQAVKDITESENETGSNSALLPDHSEF